MRQILIYLFVTFSLSLFSQSSSNELNLKATPENFQLVMEMNDPSSMQLDTMMELFGNYKVVNIDTALIIGQKALDETTTQKNLSGQVRSLIIIGIAQSSLGDFENAENNLEKAISIAKTIDGEEYIAKASNSLGMIKINQSKYVTALQYFIDVIEIWDKKEEKNLNFQPYMNIAWCYFNLGEFDKAQGYLSICSEMADSFDDDMMKIFVTTNQASIYKAQAESYQLSIDTALVSKNIYRDSILILNQKALDKYEQSLSLTRASNDMEGTVFNLNNIVLLKTYMNDLEEALRLGQEVIPLANNLGIKSEVIRSKFNLAKVYQSLNQNDKAILLGEESHQLAMKSGKAKEQDDATILLYEIYKKKGKHEKALMFFEEHEKYLREVGDVERNKAMAEIEGKFQNVKKEKQIMELETANEKVVAQRNNIIGGTLLLSLLSFLVFQFMKIRRERNDKRAFAEALIFAQEEERKRIARDLHDGVGQSLLLIKKQMASTHETTVENQQMISDTLEEVRSISKDLHPFQLEKFGLTTAIDDMILKVEKSTDLFITKEMENIDKVFSSKREIHIFRAIQEALNNIVKHAEATAAKVIVQSVDNKIVIKIMDNGKGYDHELTVVKSKSLGIRTMYERISSMGGKVKIEKNVPSGTMITFTIPK